MVEIEPVLRLLDAVVGVDKPWGISEFTESIYFFTSLIFSALEYVSVLWPILITWTSIGTAASPSETVPWVLSRALVKLDAILTDSALIWPFESDKISDLTRLFALYKLTLTPTAAPIPAISAVTTLFLAAVKSSDRIFISWSTFKFLFLASIYEWVVELISSTTALAAKLAPCAVNDTPIALFSNRLSEFELKSIEKISVDFVLSIYEVTLFS